MDFSSILIISYFLLFAFLAWQRIEWAVFVVAFSLPIYIVRFQILGIPFTVLEGGILVLFTVWLIKKLKAQSAKRKDKENSFIQILKQVQDDIGTLRLPLILFIVAATISVFVAPDLRAAGGVWKAYFVEPILFLVVFINVIKNKNQVHSVLTILGLSTLTLALIAIYQKFTGFAVPAEWLEAGRVTSVYGFPNAVGLFLAPLVTIFAGLSVQVLKKNLPQSPPSKGGEPGHPPLTKGRTEEGSLSRVIPFFYLLVTIMGSLAILFAQSKGAMLGIFAGFLFYTFFFKGRRLIFGGILGLVIIVTIAFAPHLLDLQGGATVTGGGSLEVRLDQWQESLAMLTDRPILGAGLAGFQETIAPYHQKEYIEIFLYPHNIILNFWSETGLLGLIAFVWILILFYRIGFSAIRHSENKIAESRSRTKPGMTMSDVNGSTSAKASVDRQLSVVAMAAMTTLLAHGLVDVPYFKNDLSVLFWILVGLIILFQNLIIKKPYQSKDTVISS